MFPNPDYSDAKNPISQGQIYYIPSTGRFSLDENTGVEHIFVVASVSPRQALVDLYTQYNEEESVVGKHRFLKELLQEFDAIKEEETDGDVGIWIFPFEHN